MVASLYSGSKEQVSEIIILLNTILNQRSSLQYNFQGRCFIYPIDAIDLPDGLQAFIGSSQQVKLGSVEKNGKLTGKLRYF